jgi:hypothetical protein
MGRQTPASIAAKARQQKPSPRFRGAAVARAAGTESTHQRCPKCKQLRRRWFLANHMYPGRKLWERIEEGKSKVCHICVARHQGLPLPGANLKTKKVKPPREQPPRQP